MLVNIPSVNVHMEFQIPHFAPFGPIPTIECRITALGPLAPSQPATPSPESPQRLAIVSTMVSDSGSISASSTHSIASFSSSLGKAAHSVKRAARQAKTKAKDFVSQVTGAAKRRKTTTIAASTQAVATPQSAPASVPTAATIIVTATTAAASVPSTSTLDAPADAAEDDDPVAELGTFIVSLYSLLDSYNVFYQHKSRKRGDRQSTHSSSLTRSDLKLTRADRRTFSHVDLGKSVKLRLMAFVVTRTQRINHQQLISVITPSIAMDRRQLTMQCQAPPIPLVPSSTCSLVKVKLQSRFHIALTATSKLGEFFFLFLFIYSLFCLLAHA